MEKVVRVRHPHLTGFICNIGGVHNKDTLVCGAVTPANLLALASPRQGGMVLKLRSSLGSTGMVNRPKQHKFLATMISVLSTVSVR